MLSITAYAFWATRRGVDFTFMAPFLLGCLTAMIIWSFVQLFFPPGPVGSTIFSLMGAMMFSAYLILDTQLLIARFEIDDYVWASITLYLGTKREAPGQCMLCLLHRRSKA